MTATVNLSMGGIKLTCFELVTEAEFVTFEMPSGKVYQVIDKDIIDFHPANKVEVLNEN